MRIEIVEREREREREREHRVRGGFFTCIEVALRASALREHLQRVRRNRQSVYLLKVCTLKVKWQGDRIFGRGHRERAH